MSKSTTNSNQLPLFDPIIIKLTKGYQTIIDPIDADLRLMGWHSHNVPHSSRVYAVHIEKGKKAKYLHRIIYARIIGRELERHEHVDHKDNNPLNNCRNNLRLATHAQNMQNRKQNANSKQPYKGVAYDKRKKRWVAYIYIEHKRVRLGRFTTAEKAYAAYCKAAIEHYGEFARLE